MRELEERMLFQKEQCNGPVGTTGLELANAGRPSMIGKDHNIMTASRWIDASDATLEMNGNIQEARP